MDYITDVLCNMHLYSMFVQALEKAKEAEKKEKAVVRLRKQISQGEPTNLDLTYSVSSFSLPGPTYKRALMKWQRVQRHFLKN